MVDHSSTTNSTLTLDVVSGPAAYSANITGTSGIHIVKEGERTRRFAKGSPYTVAPASITVNEGFLQWNGDEANWGTVTVNSGGKIGGSGWINDVVFNSGSATARLIDIRFLCE